MTQFRKLRNLMEVLDYTLVMEQDLLVESLLEQETSVLWLINLRTTMALNLLIVNNL
jgi:hypothetical protein